MTRTATKKKKPVGGPFLAAAIFCDNIVLGADGVLSAIRIIDTINVTLPADAPPDIPSESNRIPVRIWLLVMLKAGSARGKHDVGLVIHSPSGRKELGPKQTITLGRPIPGAGSNLRIQLGIAIQESGQFMVDVLLDGKVITRMPLTIAVTREEPAPPPKRAPRKQAKPKRKRIAKKKRTR